MRAKLGLDACVTFPLCKLLGYLRHAGPDKSDRWQILKTSNNCHSAIAYLMEEPTAMLCQVLVSLTQNVQLFFEFII